MAGMTDKLKKLYAELSQTDDTIDRLKAKDRYADYVRYVHKYDTEFKIAVFQKYICDMIQDLIESKLLNSEGEPYEGIVLSLPTQHGKSRTVTETLPSWYLGKYPYRHVVEVSYGDEFADKFGRRNKEKIVEFGKTIFDIELSKVKQSATEFEIEKTRGGMLSKGFGGGINGMPADLTIVDDPYKNRTDADSQLYKKFIIDEWLNVIRLRASSKCKYIIVHTRWNEDDLIGYLLTVEPDKWFEINFPLECEVPEKVTGRKVGDALLPEAGKDKAWIAKLKSSFMNDPSEGGLRAWNALMQGRPSSIEGNMIKRDYWKRFDLSLEMQKSGYFPVKIQSWDCALKDTSDPVAGHVWGKRGANCYLLDHIGGRMDFVKTIEGVIAFTKKHPDAGSKLIEDKANGSATIRLLRDKIGGLIPVNPGTKSKTERVSRILFLWQAGNVYIPSRIETSPGVWEPCMWANAIIEQCAAFKPDKKIQRDDEVDVCSQSLNWLYFQTANIAEEQKRDSFFGREEETDSFFGESPDQSFFDYGGD